MRISKTAVELGGRKEKGGWADKGEKQWSVQGKGENLKWEMDAA